MNPEFLDRSTLHNRSISVTRYYNRELISTWHYHEQVEIVGIINNTGTIFVGDSIEKYESGDIVMIGKNLPHMWQNDVHNNRIENNHLELEVVTIHLGNIFTNNDTLVFPELSSLKNLVELSGQGIAFYKAEGALKKIKSLYKLDVFQQLLAVIDIMNDLVSLSQYELLCSIGFVEKINEPKEDRLQKVHDYLMNNFHNKVDLIKASERANMNPSSFSRYFKQMYGKTFSQYVNEIRLGYACKLLLKDQFSVTEACFESGFNNISNFNKQFKRYYKMSPKKYVQRFNSTLAH